MDDNTLIQCPECCKVSYLDECEVGGADEGMVFCPSPIQRDFQRYAGIEDLSTGPGCGAEFAVADGLALLASVDERLAAGRIEPPDASGQGVLF